jgi:hypothetical protein
MSHPETLPIALATVATVKLFCFKEPHPRSVIKYKCIFTIIQHNIYIQVIRLEYKCCVDRKNSFVFCRAEQTLYFWALSVLTAV